MRGRDRDGMGRRRRAAVALSLAALASVAALAPAVDAKKRKGWLGSQHPQRHCPAVGGERRDRDGQLQGEDARDGGGFTVAPNFTPPATGLRTLPTLDAPPAARAGQPPRRPTRTLRPLER